ncbi:HAMP domain-containing histidine kinase [Nocardioides sp. ChNu-153]|uniref:sensor histidine kinase n=1 Tax=unclassified Nocardioides TaxID=2615069 RepID=UPI0024065958|nr:MULTISPECIES: HAMP domain-containing sensor histidine kinase [unclassified Nocardioides]MDF9716832.1 HAMP domain-containing histidine kinase [Nocardioides sp. ChNu-99]MDN7120218.1 HAMP domain-containing histidine kinase [Nocardioides sp. ChNu-153]
MLGPERDVTLRGRVRVFVVWQLPTLLLTAYLATALALTAPHLLASTPIVLSLALVAAASVAALAAPWERWGLAWRIVVPAATLLATVVLRLDLGDLRSIGLLSVLPLTWLAFEFGGRGIVLALAGAFAQSAWTFVGPGTGLSTGLAWVQASLFPVVTIAVVVTARSLAMLLQRKQDDLLASRAALREQLDLARHRLLVAERVTGVIDAGVCYLDDRGRPALLNPYARHLAALAGYDASQPVPVGPPPGSPHRVFYEDRVTPVPAREQIVARARRGDDEPGRLYWVGPPGDQRAMMASCHQLWEGRAPSGGGQHRGPLPGTGTGPGSGAADERADEPPVHLGSVVAAWDVTELTEAVEVRDRFLSTVSHELRTPLTSIIGHNELLAEALENGGHRPGDPRLVRSVDSARRNAAVLMGRINDLLEASREDLADVGGDRSPTDLADLARQAHDRHRALAAERSTTLRLDVPPAPVRVLAQPRLAQAVDQLVSNAVKHSPDGGCVTITVRREDGPNGPDAVVAVRDTGDGMTPAEARQAFTRFYRTERARRSATQGLGIGLPVAQRVVAAHAGTIELDSAPGAGTTATIRLPQERTP